MRKYTKSGKYRGLAQKRRARARQRLMNHEYTTYAQKRSLFRSAGISRGKNNR